MVEASDTGGLQEAVPMDSQRVAPPAEGDAVAAIVPSGAKRLFEMVSGAKIGQSNHFL